jgi:hypothetical protein
MGPAHLIDSARSPRRSHSRQEPAFARRARALTLEAAARPLNQPVRPSRLAPAAGVLDHLPAEHRFRSNPAGEFTFEQERADREDRRKEHPFHG